MRKDLLPIPASTCAQAGTCIHTKTMLIEYRTRVTYRDTSFKVTWRTFWKLCSLISSTRKHGLRCPFSLLRSCGTRDQATLCLCVQEPALSIQQVSSENLQPNLLLGSRGQSLSQNLSAGLLALQLPPSLTFQTCFRETGLPGVQAYLCILPR